MIRLAEKKDIPDILAIYAPYIHETTVTFEYEEPSLEEFTRRFEDISRRYPWLVWEEQGQLLGYAYASRAFARRAYAWDADLSIYLDMDARGRGIAGRLYDCLEELMRSLGYYNLYAVITGENTASVRFHERRGYTLLGNLKKSGWKHGRWLDVLWYGLRVNEADEPGGAPENFVCTEEHRAMMARYSGER